jgi:hypothetical protein
VYFNNPAGGYKQVQNLRVASGTLRIDHKGGPLSVYHSHIVSGVCGSVGYQLFYGDGPVFRDELDYNSELDNNAFDFNLSGYDLAVTAYQGVAGCVLGQAGKKGGYLDSVHSAIPGWNDYINDDVTESPAYLVGQVACGIAFPYATLARDFTADVLRGDYAGAALDSLGYLKPVQAILKNSDVIPAFLIKNSQNAQEPTKLTRYLVDNGLIGASHDEALGTLDKVFAGSASRLVDPVKNTADDLINAALKGFDLKTVRSVENINGNTRVLTETRYTHILDRHVTGLDPGSGRVKTSFFPMGNEVRPGVGTPNLMTETDLNRLISNSQKSVTPTEVARDLVYRWNPNEFGITDMKTVAKKVTGEIVTSYPIDGPNVVKVF